MSFPLVDQWKGNSPLNNSQGDGIAVAILMDFWGSPCPRNDHIFTFSLSIYVNLIVRIIVDIQYLCFELQHYLHHVFMVSLCFPVTVGYALSFLLAWQVSTYDPLFVAKEFSFFPNPNIQSSEGYVPTYSWLKSSSSLDQISHIVFFC